MIFFRDIACDLIVFGQRVVFVAEIHLCHLLHVFRQIEQALFNLIRLGPDTSIDQLIVIISKVHQPCKVFTQTDRIDQGKPHPPCRSGQQELQRGMIDGLDNLLRSWSF